MAEAQATLTEVRTVDWLHDPTYENLRLDYEKTWGLRTFGPGHEANLRYGNFHLTYNATGQAASPAAVPFIHYDASESFPGHLQDWIHNRLPWRTVP